ncbi:acyltransferase [uncultured Polaribacter sp.]|uniref:acyltransferase n=1 Tax=uncultured Polaribacter sp. TaxID=174711 RepID=UPI002603D654|nr:acyltransferase [uncultured Polaribacter sp.]
MKILNFIYLILDKISWFYHRLNYNIYSSKYDIHKTFNYNGKGILFHGDGEIVIKENSYIGRYSYLQTSYSQKIQIGKSVSISHLVYIYTKSNIANQDFKTKGINNEFSIKKGNVIIGNYCWIGAKVFINPGIEIGENTVVGANSVVTRNLPPNAIVGGIPAKVISFKSYLNEQEVYDLSKQYYSVLSDSLKLNLSDNKKIEN